MKNLEQTIENGFKSNLNRIMNLTAGKIAVYSLAGILGASLGYSCGSDTLLPQQISPSCKDSNECGEGRVCVDNKCVYSKGTGGDTYTGKNDILAGFDVKNGLGDAGADKGDSKQNGSKKDTENGGSVICWEKTFGKKSYDECAKSIQQTKDGGYIVAGEKDTSENDAWVLKLDEKGDLDCK